MKHVPGPLGVDYGYADYLAICTAEGDVIATIDVDEHGAKPTQEQVAYAHLFAESPALLEALEWLVRLEGEIYPIESNLDEWSEWEDALAFAMEAIARAKGEHDGS